MPKKYLRKNEFRIDFNPRHLGSNKEPHPAYITAKHGHKLKANNITHARTVNGVKNYDVDENPNKNSRDRRQTRFTPPYWQNESQFSKTLLNNFRFSNKNRKYIRKINKKYK